MTRSLRVLSLIACLAAAGCVSLRPVASLRTDFTLPAARLLPTSVGEVYLELGGEPGAPPVVLLHGFGASVYSWRKVASELAAAGFQVVALDLAGFGYSERPVDRAAYTPAGQAAVVAEILERLAPELGTRLGPGAVPPPVHLVGHSFGGGVALSLAASRPELVRSLVLLDTTLPTHSRAPRAGWPLYRPVAYLLLRTIGLRRWFVRRALELAFHDDALVTSELVDAYRERLLYRGPASAYRSLTGPLPRERLAVELAAIGAPTLVVWGEEDALIPVEAGRRAAGRIPGARFTSLPECGHLPMEECPEALLEAVLGFLGSD